MSLRRSAVGWLRSLVLFLFIALPCSAHAEVSKDACVEAHGQGQDARAAGKLTLARRLFITCAQSSCPALVQSDCARFADELSQQLPALSFAARDGAGNDLPETSVVLDGRLLSTRIDGTLHEVDPGKHAVRFTHQGREQLVTVVVASGERGRTVVATFEAAPGSARKQVSPATPVTEPPQKRRRGPAAALIGSAAVTAAGVALVAVGVARVPEGCTLSTRECAAPPGDPTFGEAASAVRLANTGFVIGGVGALALSLSALWYLRSGNTRKMDTALSPWGTRDGAGIVLRGRL